MQRFSLWIQIVTAVGMLTGLALVLIQLQQNEELVRYQIAADLRVNQDSARNIVRGETYSTTLAKIQTTPDSLTDAEVVEFEAHAASIVSELQFRRVLNEAGIFEGGWRTWLVGDSCKVLNNQVGKAWLDHLEGRQFDAEIIEELRRRNGECGSTFLQEIRSKSRD